MKKLCITAAIFFIWSACIANAAQQTIPQATEGSKQSLNSINSKIEANFTDLYTNKADTATTYTKTDVDTALALKRDKAAIACASGFVLQGITINGTAECIAASSASLPTGTEGQVISYDINGDPVASTVQDLAFSETDFVKTTVGNVVTYSLASPASGASTLAELTDWPVGLTATELGYVDGARSNLQSQIDGVSVGSPVTTAPAYKDTACTKGQYAYSTNGLTKYECVASNTWFTSTLSDTLSLTPVTYSLGFTLSGVSGADKLTINGADYTAGTTITGLSGDVAVTGTLGSSTALSCTGTGISGSGLSYLASMTAARSMACVFSTASVTSRTLRPASDTLKDWTASTGTTHYNLLNSVATDDTTYVSTATAYKGDVFLFETLPDDGKVIASVTVHGRFSNTVSEAKTRMVCYNGTPLYGAYFTPSSTLTEYTQVWTTNPATSTPWTVASVNAMSFGAYAGSITGTLTMSQLWAVVTYE